MSRIRSILPRWDQTCLLVIFLIIVGITCQNKQFVSACCSKHLFHLTKKAFWLTGILMISSIEFFWRFGLWMKYHPWTTCKYAELPTISVILPVYNEGKRIVQTIESILDSHYPTDKLQLIVVNDGSTDDTSLWLKSCATKYKNRISILTLSKNHGKRSALSLGFKHATGTIFVTVDSDCIIMKETLRELISPIIRDSQIGAVAGHIQISDSDSCIITRMLSVSFTLAFDFSRAGQSVLGCVFCTPGALSAYRADIVKKVLNEWENQTFGGCKSKIAEDRALTNFILKAGLDTVYQNTALCKTLVPKKLSGLWQMYLRWTRGNIREGIHFMRIAIHNNHKRPSLLAKLNFALSVINKFILFLLIGWGLYISITTPECLLNILVYAIYGNIVFIAWYAWNFKTWNAVYGMLYVLFWLCLCSWILPWSILTMQNNSWLSRHR